MALDNYFIIILSQNGISARLIDEADRQLMQGCLSLLWNRAWSQGYFVSAWKLENPTVGQHARFLDFA